MGEEHHTCSQLRSLSRSVLQCPTMPYLQPLRESSKAHNQLIINTNTLPHAPKPQKTHYTNRALPTTSLPMCWLWAKNTNSGDLTLTPTLTLHPIVPHYYQHGAYTTPHNQLTINTIQQTTLHLPHKKRTQNGASPTLSITQNTHTYRNFTKTACII
jgi:hypothetical protein